MVNRQGREKKACRGEKARNKRNVGRTTEGEQGVEASQREETETEKETPETEEEKERAMADEQRPTVWSRLKVSAPSCERAWVVSRAPRCYSSAREGSELTAWPAGSCGCLSLVF